MTNKNKLGDIINSNNISIIQENIREQNNIYSITNIVNPSKEKAVEIATKHKLEPFFKTGYNIREDGEFGPYSVPVLAKAEELFPEQYKFNFTITDSRFIGIKDREELLDRMRHSQTAIAIKMNNAVKLLGDCPDPHQPKIFNSKNNEAFLTPEPLAIPQFSFKCHIYIKNIQYKIKQFDLKLVDKPASFECMFSNEHQINHPIIIYINVNLKTNQCNFSFNIREYKEKDSKSLMQYIKFLLATNNEGFTLKAKDRNFEYISDSVNFLDNERIKYLNHLTSTLNKIFKIEKYFSIKCETSFFYTKEEYAQIDKMYNMLLQVKQKLKLKDISATLTKRGDNSLVNLNSDESINISIKEEGVQYNLLNTVIKINKIETTYFNVIYEDEALIREFYDSGSTELNIRIKFKPKVGKYIKYSLKITL